jgi:hypothetical protein
MTKKNKTALLLASLLAVAVLVGHVVVQADGVNDYPYTDDKTAPDCSKKYGEYS